MEATVSTKLMIVAPENNHPTSTGYELDVKSDWLEKLHDVYQRDAEPVADLQKALPASLPPVVHIRADRTSLMVGGCSKEGYHHTNEDRVLIIEDFSSFLEEAGLGDMLAETLTILLVLDGHGGGWAASYTQTYFARALVQQFQRMEGTNNNLGIEAVEKAFYKAVLQIEDEVIKIERDTRETSGCCFLGAAIFGGQLITANAGDCRGIMLHSKSSNGRPEEMFQQLTTDHTLRTQAERMRVITEGGMIRDNRISGLLEPSRAIGDVDFKPLGGGRILIADPEMKTYPATAGNVLILATDGVWDVVSNYRVAGEMLRLVKRGDDVSAVASALVELAVHCNSYDDVSVIVVYF